MNSIMFGMLMDHVILLVVLRPVKQDISMISRITVHARQHFNGLMKIAGAPESVTKSKMHFLIKAQMRILVNATKDTPGMQFLMLVN